MANMPHSSTVIFLSFSEAWFAVLIYPAWAGKVLLRPFSTMPLIRSIPLAEAAPNCFFFSRAIELVIISPHNCPQTLSTPLSWQWLLINGSFLLFCFSFKIKDPSPPEKNKKTIANWTHAFPWFMQYFPVTSGNQKLLVTVLILLSLLILRNGAQYHNQS